MSKHTHSQSSHTAPKPVHSVKPKSGKPNETIKSSRGSDLRHEAISAELEPELQHHMIEIAAYYRAEQRGFRGENSLDDWLAAEAEIGALLSS